MKEFKPSAEAQEFLNTVFQSDMYPSLPGLLEAITAQMVKDMVHYNIQSGSDRELAYKKAKVDGAKELIAKFIAYKKNFKFQ